MEPADSAARHHHVELRKEYLDLRSRWGQVLLPVTAKQAKVRRRVALGFLTSSATLWVVFWGAPGLSQSMGMAGLMVLLAPPALWIFVSRCVRDSQKGAEARLLTSFARDLPEDLRERSQWYISQKFRDNFAWYTKYIETHMEIPPDKDPEWPQLVPIVGAENIRRAKEEGRLVGPDSLWEGLTWRVQKLLRFLGFR